MTENCFIGEKKKVFRRTGLSFYLIMPERAAGKQSAPCLQLPLRHWNCSWGSLGWLCCSSFSATGCTDRGRNVSQISPSLLFQSTFNLSREIAGALSMSMRTFFGKSNSQWNRGEKKNYYNLSASVMKCWDRRKKGGMESYQGAPYLKSSRWTSLAQRF